MTDFTALIAKLEAWSRETATFHGDQQLSDELLIAAGWRCEPEPAFEGGVRWYVKMGIAQYSTGERSRPHPLFNVADAIALVPHDATLQILRFKSGVRADILTPRYMVRGTIDDPREMAVAICRAVAQALAAQELVNSTVKAAGA